MKEKYNILVNLILKCGERYPKKHGNWIKLNYINDYSFCMDSWNKTINLMKNAEFKFNDYGFVGERIICLGIDFGSFKCYVKEEQLDCWIENLKYELGLEYDFSKIKLDCI